MSSITSPINRALENIVNSTEKEKISNIILEKNTNLYWQDISFKIAMSERTQVYWIKKETTFSQFLEHIFIKLKQDFQLPEEWELVPNHDSLYEGCWPPELAPSLSIYYENEVDPTNQGRSWADLPGTVSKWLRFDTFYIRTRACLERLRSMHTNRSTGRIYAVAECPICMSIIGTINQPYTCEHHICSTCTQEWNRARSGRDTCPLCRASRSQRLV